MGISKIFRICIKNVWEKNLEKVFTFIWNLILLQFDDDIDSIYVGFGLLFNSGLSILS